MTTVSDIRICFPNESENGVNSNINYVLYVKVVYTNMKYFFQRNDVSLPGFSRFFACKLNVKLAQLEKLMCYMNKRGGKIVLQDIPKPKNQAWNTGLEALQEALELEKQLNAYLLELDNVANKNKDYDLANFLEDVLIEEQIRVIKLYGDLITQCVRTSAKGLGEYEFDKDLEKFFQITKINV